MRKPNDIIKSWPEDPLRKPFKRLSVLVKREAKRGIKWLVFYQPENKFYAMLHIFDLIVLIYLVIRLSRG